MEAVSSPAIGQGQAEEVKTRKFTIKPHEGTGPNFMGEWLSTLEKRTGASIVSQVNDPQKGTIELTVTAGATEIIERVRDMLKTAKLLV